MPGRIYIKILKLLKLISEDEYRRRRNKKPQVFNLIEKSNLFDAKWYTKKYLENENTNLSAIEHYAEYGFKQGNKPSEHYDFSNALKQIPRFYYGLYDKNNNYSNVLDQKNEHKIENFDFKQRKVLLFSHEFTCTGAPRALLNLAKVLKENNIEFLVLSPYYGKLEEELEKNNIEYYVEPLLMLKLVFQDEMMKKFFNSFEYILCNTLISLRFAKYIQTKATKIAWIHEAAHGYEDTCARDDLQDLFNYVEKVYSVSPYAKIFADKYIDAKKSKLLTLFVDENSFDAQSNNEENKEKLSVIAVGNCSPIKAFDIYLDAISQLPKEVRDKCSFAILGKFSENKYCQEMKEKALSENVEITGELPYTKLLDRMSQANIVICSSLDESLSMSSIEAMMLKKIVICPQTSGISYYIKNKEDAYVFEHGIDKISDLIQEIYHSKDNLHEMGARAYQVYLTNFSKTVFTENALKIFDTK